MSDVSNRIVQFVRQKRLPISNVYWVTNGGDDFIFVPRSGSVRFSGPDRFLRGQSWIVDSRLPSSIPAFFRSNIDRSKTRELRSKVAVRLKDLPKPFINRDESMSSRHKNADEILDEAKKRLAGNLCVNTGQGSGGGFTRCDVGARALRQPRTSKSDKVRTNRQMDIATRALHRDAIKLGGNRIKRKHFHQVTDTIFDVGEYRQTRVYGPRDSSITDMIVVQRHAKMIHAARNVDAAERYIRSKDTAFSVFFKKNDGKAPTVAILSRDKNKIDIPHDAMERIKNTIWTHNHQGGSGDSFTVSDLVFASTANLKEIRATAGLDGSQMTWAMKRPAGGWPSQEVMYRVSQKATAVALRYANNKARLERIRLKSKGYEGRPLQIRMDGYKREQEPMIQAWANHATADALGLKLRQIGKKDAYWRKRNYDRWKEIPEFRRGELGRLASAITSRRGRSALEQEAQDLLRTDRQRDESQPGRHPEGLLGEAEKRLTGNLCVPSGKGSGSGFRRCGVGTPATDEDFVRYKIPPAYKKVVVFDGKDGLQWTGVDVKGRKKYGYTEAWTEGQKAAKYARLQGFNEDLQGIRAQIAKDMNSNDPVVRDTARVVALVDKTFIRIGSTTDTKADKQAYGASTLLSKHISVVGDDVNFSYTGKKGVERDFWVRGDKEFAALMSEQIKGKGPDDRIFNTSGQKVNSYLNKICEGCNARYTIKDFRTYHATRIANEFIQKAVKDTENGGTGLYSLKDKRSANRVFQTAKKKVAEKLGNTPAVAFKSYINPMVWQPFTEAGYGDLVTPKKAAPKKVTAKQIAAMKKKRSDAASKDRITDYAKKVKSGEKMTDKDVDDFLADLFK